LAECRCPATGKLAASQRMLLKRYKVMQAHALVSALLTAATDYQSCYQLLATVGSDDHY